MAAMDWGKVLTDMLAAAQGVAKDKWPALRKDAEDQFKVLTQIGARIEARKAAQDISETNARFLMSQYKIASQNVLFSVEGLANLLVEQAWNKALDVLRDAVKTATSGWILL